MNPPSIGNVWWIPVALLIGLVALIGFRTLPDYGISWDEDNHITDAMDLYALIQDGTPIPGTQRYYGQLFNFVGEGLFRVITRVVPIDPEGKFRDPYRQTRVLHGLTFATALLILLLVGHMGRHLAGPKFAIVAPTILVLMPRFWGHSFYNSKDIPFAMALTLVSLAAPLIALRVLDATKPTRIAALFMLFGILVGIGSTTRLGMVGFVPLMPFLLIVMEPARLRTKWILYWSLYFVIAIAAWLATTIALYPVSWGEPLAWLQRAFTYFSMHPFKAKVLFESTLVHADYLPRRYAITYFWITTPLLWMILAIGGVMVSIVRWGALGRLQKGLIAALLFQMLALPAYAFLKHSTLYDGIRQFLFVVPVLAVFATYTVSTLHDFLPRKMRILLWLLLAVYGVTIVREMHELHPYEAAYFQEAVGGLAGAGHDFDTDYWGLSMREAAEWVNASADSGDVLVLGGNARGVRAFIDWSLKPLTLQDYNRRVEKPVARYYIGVSRYDLADRFPESPVVFTIERRGIVLSFVKEIVPGDESRPLRDGN